MSAHHRAADAGTGVDRAAARDEDLACACALVVEANGPPWRLSLWRAAALAGVSERALRAALPRLAPLVPEVYRPAVLSWPRGVRGFRRPDADLAAAVTLLVECEGRYALDPAAKLAGCDPAYLLRRLPHLDLPGDVRLVVEGCRPGARPRLVCSDQTLAAAVALVHEQDGWVNLERVGLLAGLAEAAVRQRLPGVLYLLSEADRAAALSRLAEDDLDRECGEGYEAPLPLAPTSALAGSAEKIAVLRARALARKALHHPEDSNVLGNVSDRTLEDDVVRGLEALRRRRRGRRPRPLRCGAAGRDPSERSACPTFRGGGGDA
jgi:hypothetical protein